MVSEDNDSAGDRNKSNGHGQHLDSPQDKEVLQVKMDPGAGSGIYR